MQWPSLVRPGATRSATGRQAPVRQLCERSMARTCLRIFWRRRASLRHSSLLPRAPHAPAPPHPASSPTAIHGPCAGTMKTNALHPTQTADKVVLQACLPAELCEGQAFSDWVKATTP